MKSIKSKYGGDIKFPFVMMREIFEVTGKYLSNSLQKWGYLFDKIEMVDSDIYKASIKDIKILVDDSRENEIIYFWRSENKEDTIYRSFSRTDETSEKLYIDDSRISQNLIFHSYHCFHKFLISDDDKNLQFKSFIETTQIDEWTREEYVSYTENGTITTPTEGWLEILRESEVITAMPVFADKKADEHFQLYGIAKITDGIDPKNLWLQDFIHSIRENARDDYLAQLSHRHFATDSSSASLRKSLVLTNKVKIVLKLSGDFFVDRKATDIIYFIVFKPKNTDMGIGKILFGDFTVPENKTRLKDSFWACVDFLNWDLITRPQWIKVVRINELKEPFLLDPSKYVR
ncbi:MAG: hypothetical protein ACD_71C00113G0003 [uncultured bacterium (gcode 4)]|uniref:Uncharacterized protein n=1 Tax=uncultured bacterium (gcode 4) TaxID=1234023 RepID=K1Z5J2_9BACT|nr:MAG: hypothetical protein ACD_71C00113G0003 [uncultured bacterium (gcode 4)]